MAASRPGGAGISVVQVSQPTVDQFFSLPTGNTLASNLITPSPIVPGQTLSAPWLMQNPTTTALNTLPTGVMWVPVMTAPPGGYTSTNPFVLVQPGATPPNPPSASVAAANATPADSSDAPKSLTLHPTLPNDSDWESTQAKLETLDDFEATTPPKKKSAASVKPDTPLVDTAEEEPTSPKKKVSSAVEDNKDASFSERTGDMVGKAVTELLDDHPEWIGRLQETNFTDSINGVRDKYQHSRLLRLTTDHVIRPRLNQIPDPNARQAAEDIVDWLKAKPGDKNPVDTTLKKLEDALKKAQVAQAEADADTDDTFWEDDATSGDTTPVTSDSKAKTGWKRFVPGFIQRRFEK